MAETNGTRPHFNVGLTGWAREQLRHVIRQGIYTYSAEVALDSFRQIVRRLQSHPREAGEPLYELNKMRVQVRRIGWNPLYVEYGVHYDKPLVVVRHVGWLAGPESE
jgi:hypothetical protein